MTINTANKFTLCRILLIPFFVILLIYNYIGTSLFIFAAASLTDALDGFIARKWDQKTRLGTFLDPMADKALLVASFIALAILGILPSWLAVITISRDLIIVFGSLIVYILTGNVNFYPTFLGKITTVAQILTILSALLGHLIQNLNLYISISIWLTTIFTIISGFHYLYIGMGMFNETS